MKQLLIIITWLFTISASAQNLDAFKKEIYKDNKGNSLPYRILYPKNYDKSSSYSLVIFLHGMGERGNDNEKQLTYISEMLLNEREKGQNEAIVVLPQCPEDDMWVDQELRENLKGFKNLYTDKRYPITKSTQLVSELLDKLLEMPQVNKEMVSITGASMGGFGTLDLLSRRPETFAKAAPICGGGIIDFANDYANTTSIRLFHGGADVVVTPDLSRALYDRLQTLAADVTYTEYPNVNHGSWINAFAEPDFLKWLTKPTNTKYILKKDISYIKDSETDAYMQERCKLDIYYPTNKKNFATVVWFHGGGLEGGSKEIPDELTKKGIAVVGVNYRLNPRANNPAYIEDAAAAVAWTFKNIEALGGSVEDIYVSGHSAGGYLTLMVGLDKEYLARHDVDADKIKGLLPISGQTNTHYTIRKERQIPMEIPVIDKYAPLNNVRIGIPPTLLITGDRNLEMTARYEENLHLETMLKTMGNKEIKLYELEGFDHGTVYTPACLLILRWIKEHSK